MIAVWIALGAWFLVALLVELLAWRAVRLADRETPECFRAPVDVESDGVSLAFLGDVQRGIRDVARPLKAALDERPADLLVSSGDFVSHGEAPYYGVALAAFDRARIDTPTRVVPGNHDLCPRGSDDPAAGEHLFAGRIGPLTWEEKVGPLLLAGLHVALRGFGEAERKTLAASLDGHAGPWIAVCHRPPRRLDLDGAPVEPDCVELVSLFEARPPALVVCGHAHEFVEREVNGVRYVVNAHGGDVHGLDLGRDPFELLRVDVAADGGVRHVITRHRRIPSPRVHLDQLAVRCWWSRRRLGGQVLSLPVGLPLALLRLRAPLR